jgi:hypothetical protein
MKHAVAFTKHDAIRLLREYLEEVSERHPEELSKQLSASVWFAIGYLEGWSNKEGGEK